MKFDLLLFDYTMKLVIESELWRIVTMWHFAMSKMGKTLFCVEYLEIFYNCFFMALIEFSFIDMSISNKSYKCS